MKPKITTTRDLIRTVADRWAAQYPIPYTLHDGRSTAEFHAKLVALDKETATPADIEAILGNNWTTMTCDACGCQADWTCTVGQEPDYESSTARLCVNCLKDAAALIPA